MTDILEIYSVMQILRQHFWGCGPGRVVGVAIGYGLDGPGIESR